MAPLVIPEATASSSIDIIYLSSDSEDSIPAPSQASENNDASEKNTIQGPTLLEVCSSIANSSVISHQAKCFLFLAATVPRGRYTTYRSIVDAYCFEMGGMTSLQNVGRALRKNPFPGVLPCHRVVAGNGGIGAKTADWGMHVGSMERNRRMLEAEDVRFDRNGRLLGGQIYPHEFDWNTPALKMMVEERRLRI
ncbi:hypothetical protein MMC12_005019 [Toensbergia leucococca]|nr:hypothetical protein [Toensbergia leucococca]